MVQGDRPRLDVRPDAHLRGRPDDDVDLPGAALLEQECLLAVVVGLVDEADPGRVHAARDELVPQVLVDVEGGGAGRGAQVAEHDRHRTLDLRVLLKRLAEPQSVAERVRDHDGWAAGEGWVNARAKLGVWA